MRIRLSTIWSWLALAVVLIWTLLPVYWFLKNSLLTPDEIARFPPPLYPLEPTPAAFFNIFGFEYEMADGLVRRGSGQANQIGSTFRTRTSSCSRSCWPSRCRRSRPSSRSTPCTCSSGSRAR